MGIELAVRGTYSLRVTLRGSVARPASRLSQRRDLFASKPVSFSPITRNQALTDYDS
jgi:hypothetical protein